MPRKVKKISNNAHKIKRCIYKKRKTITKRSVKKMISMMNPTNAEKLPHENVTEPDSTNHNVEEFLSTGRTGRRNALPDILGEHSLVSSSELPNKLESLTTADNVNNPNKPSTSKETSNNGVS